jgi:cadmium resistance protein CadD (predicted permease)
MTKIAIFLVEIAFFTMKGQDLATKKYTFETYKHYKLTLLPKYQDL